jgi:hypothetical protein
MYSTPSNFNHGLNPSRDFYSQLTGGYIKEAFLFLLSSQHNVVHHINTIHTNSYLYIIFDKYFDAVGLLFLFRKTIQKSAYHPVSYISISYISSVICITSSFTKTALYLPKVTFKKFTIPYLICRCREDGDRTGIPYGDNRRADIYTLQYCIDGDGV